MPDTLARTPRSPWSPDVMASLHRLKSQPAADHSRITAMGWSYGARAVLVALANHTGSQLGFSRAGVYYPDCRALEPRKSGVPVLMLLGGDDEMTPAKLCQEAVNRVSAPAPVKIVVYPGAVHGREIEQFLRADR